MSVVKTQKTFKEIARQRLSISSRLNSHNILNITETNQYFMNPFRVFSINDDIKRDNNYFTIHYALEDEWWDNISAKYYGTSYYWYILCEYNDIINPYEQLLPGQLVKVLKISFMYHIFRDMKGIAEL